jgi:hypothetical protein
MRSRRRVKSISEKMPSTLERRKKKEREEMVEQREEEEEKFYRSSKANLPLTHPRSDR